MLIENSKNNSFYLFTSQNFSLCSLLNISQSLDWFHRYILRTREKVDGDGEEGGRLVGRKGRNLRDQVMLLPVAGKNITEWLKRRPTMFRGGTNTLQPSTSPLTTGDDCRWPKNYFDFLNEEKLINLRKEKHF